MTNYESCMAAIQRPDNYGKLSAERQWDIDKSLGILDWDGLNMEAANETIETEDRGRAIREFKMSLPELETVVRRFNIKFPPAKPEPT
jgi:hypothetical protein